MGKPKSTLQLQYEALMTYFNYCKEGPQAPTKRRMKGKALKAFKLFKRAAETAPEYSSPYAYMASICYSHGMFEESLDHLNRAIDYTHNRTGKAMSKLLFNRFILLSLIDKGKYAEELERDLRNSRDLDKERFKFDEFLSRIKGESPDLTWRKP